MLAEIVRQDDDWLEITHDYIQWLFPLAEHSRVTPGAPILLPTDIQAFRSDSLLRNHVLVAFRRMLSFFGLTFANARVTKSSTWQQRRGNWFTESTHNNLRITRILKSLMLLGLEAEAHAFHACLRELCATESECAVPAESQAFWVQAVSSSKASGA